MTLAPKLDDLKEKQQKKQTEGVMTEGKMPTHKQQAHLDIAPDGIISWQLIGAGGAGKVAAIRYANSAKHKTKITTIDTSGVTKAVDGVESIRISELNGSGKLRRENIDEITNFISDYVSKTLFMDVNVVIHSFSGGSGSVIGPLMIDEILRQNKQVIVIGIIDTDSEVDTINALNTLRTLDNITKNRNGYVPLVLFNNDNGRAIVDRGIDTITKYISALLDIPYIGLDMQDRIKFLKPSSFDGVENGVKLINLSKQADGEWEDLGMIIPKESNERLDATIVISRSDEHLRLTKKCSVTFRGYYEGDGENLIASIGYQIPSELITDLNAKIHSFRSMTAPKKTEIKSEYEIGNTTRQGVVL